MPETLQKIETARQYLEEIVVPDFDDFVADRTSLRKAFHCAGSLFHLHDWVWVEHSGTFSSCNNEKELSAELARQSTDFAAIRDVANAAKHMALRSGTVVTHAANTAVQTTAYGEGKYGQGPFGGSPRVRIHTGPTDYEEFEAVARKVLLMWKELFSKCGW